MTFELVCVVLLAVIFATIVGTTTATVMPDCTLDSLKHSRWMICIRVPLIKVGVLIGVRGRQYYKELYRCDIDYALFVIYININQL